MLNEFLPAAHTHNPWSSAKVRLLTMPGEDRTSCKNYALHFLKGSKA